MSKLRRQRIVPYSQWDDTKTFPGRGHGSWEGGRIGANYFTYLINYSGYTSLTVDFFYIS